MSHLMTQVFAGGIWLYSSIYLIFYRVIGRKLAARALHPIVMIAAKNTVLSCR